MGKIRSFIKRATADPGPLEELRNPGVRYEPVDVQAWKVLYTGAGVVLGMLLITALVYPVYQYLETKRARQTQILPASGGYTQVPPEPRLQQDPRRDLQTFRTREAVRLQTYGWLDRARGVVSNPIERAIQLTLERGIAPIKAPPGNLYFNPQEGSRNTGFEDKVEN